MIVDEEPATGRGAHVALVAAFVLGVIALTMAQARAPLLDDEPLGITLLTESVVVPFLGGLAIGRTSALMALVPAHAAAFALSGGLRLLAESGTDDLGPVLALVLGFPAGVVLCAVGLLVRAALDRWAPRSAVPLVAAATSVGVAVAIAAAQRPPTGPGNDALRGTGTLARWCALRAGMERSEVARIMGRRRSFRNEEDGRLPGFQLVGRDDVWRAGRGFVTVGFNDAQRVVSFSSVALRAPSDCHG